MDNLKYKEDSIDVRKNKYVNKSKKIKKSKNIISKINKINYEIKKAVNLFK